MQSIFLAYQNKTITGHAKLQEEYARVKGVKKEWVRCHDISVRQLIDEILDEFEDAGFDLDTLPMENVLSRFLTFEPKIEIPHEYIQLQDAKTLIENQISNTKEAEYTKDVIASMKSALQSVNEAIKGYK